MANKAPYRTTFEVAHTIQPIYTGGSVALDRTGSILATTLGEDALLTDLNTGTKLARIEGDGELISTLTLTPSASHLIVCSRSLSVRIYSLKQSLAVSSIDCELLRTFRPHTTPVVVLAVDHTGTLLATGGADGVIKVWDIGGGYATHTFRGPNVLISALHFFELPASNRGTRAAPSSNHRKNEQRRDASREESQQESVKEYLLASGNQDGTVKVWDLHKRRCTSTLESHVSDVTSVDYSSEQDALLTGSRDKTIVWWDTQTWKIKKVVPVLEEVEAVGFLDLGRFAYTGGINGNIRLWRTENGREVTEPQQARGEADAIVDAITTNDFILSIQSDHTMTLHSTALVPQLSATDSITPLEEVRRISGTHDEIIDLGYLLRDRSLLALATNSEEIRIVSLAQQSAGNQTSTYFGADVAQLKGHDDIIICLDIDWSGHWIATGAKDNTARLWKIDPVNHAFVCHATFTGHAESLGAIALPHTSPPESTPAFRSPLEHPPSFLLTGSQDQTVKRWDVPGMQAVTTGRKDPRALYTRKAHDKDINAIDVNHNSQLFASASQDRTVKIWSVEEGEVQGILRGHRRGVWSVKFGPKDTPTISGDKGPAAGKGFVITGSGDKTVKIWSLADYTCLRTFEGHANSVLKVAWLNLPKSDERGKKHVQIASAGGDGLVKIWDTSTGEVAATLDNHEDRVWALAVHPSTNMIISGSGDSTITFWEDTTSSTQAASTAAATQFVQQEQELQNYIHSKSYRQAITLALQLNHPGRLLALFRSVVTMNPPEAGSLCGVKAVDEILMSLSDEQLFTLLLRIRDWNTNARTAPVAQKILWTIMKSYPASRLANLNSRNGQGRQSTKELFNALKAYSEKHYNRMDELIDASYLVEYTLRGMDDIGILEDTATGNGGSVDIDTNMITV